MSIQDINKRLGIDLLELYSIFSSGDQDAKNAVRIKDFPRDFAESAMAILGQIKPVRTDSKVTKDNKPIYSPSLTLAGIGDEGMKKLLGLIYLCPPSKYLEAGKQPKYAGLTPKALYAQKLYNDINYMQWDVEDDSLKYFLGKQLSWLQTVRTEWNRPIDLRLDAEGKLKDASAVPELREALIGKDKPTRTYQAKIGGMPVPDFKDVHRARNAKNKRDDEVDSNAEKTYWRMLLQLWLANSSTRVIENTGTNIYSPMILDPWDWDRIPEALDGNIDVAATEAPKRRKDLEDLPF